MSSEKPARIVRSAAASAQQRRRLGTEGDNSHEDSKPLAGDDLDGFVRWFADWWLRRGRKLTDPDQGGE